MGQASRLTARADRRDTGPTSATDSHSRQGRSGMATLLQHSRSGAPEPSGRTWVPSVGTPAERDVLYVLVGCLLGVLAVLSVSFKKDFNFVVSDGRFYYVYLPSLVVDGDLDFTNQVREHWDGDYHPPLEQHRTPRGRVANKYPVGLALTLAPSFLAAHAIAHACHALTGAGWCLPNGYTLPYQLLNLLWLLTLAVASMRCVDRLLTEAFRVDPRWIALAVVTFWLGSPLFYYTFREPFMVHAAGTFWVSAALLLVWRLRVGLSAGQLPAGRLFLLTFTTAMALVCRPTNAFLASALLYLFVCVVRAGQLGQLLKQGPALVLGLVPVSVQMMTWYALYGRPVVYSYGAERFDWAHPAGWQTLFSSRHGLFFWSPLLLAAAGGFVWRLRRRPHPLQSVLLAAFLGLWYCNSCWSCWWFGDAFGGRAFLELAALWVLGLAGAFEVVKRSQRAIRWAFAGFVGLCLVYHCTLIVLYITHAISRCDYLL